MITNLKLKFYGDKLLRKKSTPVKTVGPTERMLITSMIKKMYESKGIGLAAPQVGINERIFVVDIGEGPIAVINPRIVKKRGREVMEEGCLCFPDISFRVKRAQKIVLKYLDENNNKVERGFDDLLARVMQHEIDHLDGKLIIDYASWQEKLKYRKQLKEIRKINKENQGT